MIAGGQRWGVIRRGDGAGAKPCPERASPPRTQCHPRIGALGKASRRPDAADGGGGGTRKPGQGESALGRQGR